MGWDVMNRRNDFTKTPDKYSELSVPSLYTFSQTSAHVFLTFRNSWNQMDQRGDGGRSYVPLPCTNCGARVWRHELSK